jgi:hypothetical protein
MVPFGPTSLLSKDWIAPCLCHLEGFLDVPGPETRVVDDEDQVRE